MKRFYIENNKLSEDKIILDGEEFNYLTKVLRLTAGEAVCLFCNDEYDYMCEIVEIGKKQAILHLIEKKANKQNPKLVIDIFQGLPKNEKLELITQKANELGVSSIYTFESEFCIAKNNNVKIDRMNKIAIESCKQCGRTKAVKVHSAISFAQVIDLLKNYDTVIFAYEKATKPLREVKLIGKIAIIVGSEGGFSEFEVKEMLENGYQDIKISNRILRTETASIAMAGYVAISLGDEL